MALVNYSSDESESDLEDDETDSPLPQQIAQLPVSSSASLSSVALTTSATTGTVRLQHGLCTSSTGSGETSLRLPDASELLASFTGTEASLAVGIGGNAAFVRKRSDLNGSANGPRRKIPKGNMMPLRIAPDTAGGSLLPPQLRGRSNVATEDLDKLFTKRQKPS